MFCVRAPGPVDPSLNSEFWPRPRAMFCSVYRKSAELKLDARGRDRLLFPVCTQKCDVGGSASAAVLKVGETECNSSEVIALRQNCHLSLICYQNRVYTSGNQMKVLLACYTHLHVVPEVH